MTNRTFILKCIAGLSDESLLSLWDTIYECSVDRMPIVSACEICEAEHGGECPTGLFDCEVDAKAYMRREAVLRYAKDLSLRSGEK